MAEYEEGFLHKIIDRIDLLAYIGQDLEFRKHGNEYFASCPKHLDKTPSFSVTPRVNMFYCFSCGRGGNIINYMMMYEGKTYGQAVEKAASLAKMDLSEMCRSQTVMLNRKRQREQERKGMTGKHPLLDSRSYDDFIKGPVREWLEEGIRQEEIDTFDIRLDLRSNRIVYPVYDMEGNFINVKGRTLFRDYKKLNIQKYINYYPVGSVDYFQGYYVTAPYIRDTKEIKVFEGIKSVMKLFGYGFCDGLSAEKHTLTDKQIQWLIQADIKDVVFCYDSDVSYEEKAVLRDLNILKRFLNVYIVKEKDGLLGGPEAKNSPVDCGRDVWNFLYANRKKII